MFSIFVVAIIGVARENSKVNSIDMDGLIRTNLPGASQRKVSGAESRASILLIRSLEGSRLLLPSPLAAAPKLR